MLRKLFDNHKCDKGKRHGYELIYEPFFKKIKNNKLNILEVGIFRGESLKVFVDYFPNANIYGIDIFTRLNPEDVDILNHPRIFWNKLDSTNISDPVFNDIKFDIIIDDGYHTPEANKLTFRNLFPQLKHDGVYFIEDVWPVDKMSTTELNHKWIKSKPTEYTQQHMIDFNKEISVGNVMHFDNRSAYQPDSYIIAVTK
jgi:hypothetical protein